MTQHSDFFSMLEAEAKEIELQLPDQESLDNVAVLAKNLTDLIDKRNRVEEILRKIKEAIDTIAEHKLPALFDSLNMKEFTLNDGSKITVSKEYYPSIKEEDRATAYKWLVDNGHDIIKNEVTVSLSKGQSDQAVEAINLLMEHGFSPSHKENIHGQTFKAWAKRVAQEGLPIPDIINIHVVDRAVVKGPK